MSRSRREGVERNYRIQRMVFVPLLLVGLLPVLFIDRWAPYLIIWSFVFVCFVSTSWVGESYALGRRTRRSAQVTSIGIALAALGVMYFALLSPRVEEGEPRKRKGFGVGAPKPLQIVRVGRI